MLKILRDIPPQGSNAKIFGLTGGIGAGKSTVATLLSQRGAFVVDADQVVRDLQKPGGEAVEALVDAFGDSVLDSGGGINRTALAQVAFRNDESRRLLEAIIHPRVRQKVQEIFATLEPGQVGIYDVPLLVETDMARQFAGVIVVEAPLDVRLDRLERRGISREEALRRIAAQATDEERRAVGHVVIENGKDHTHLTGVVNALWELIVH